MRILNDAGNGQKRKVGSSASTCVLLVLIRPR